MPACLCENAVAHTSLDPHIQPKMHIFTLSRNNLSDFGRKVKESYPNREGLKQRSGRSRCEIPQVDSRPVGREQGRITRHHKLLNRIHTPVEAKEAVVFLINCVNDRWKLPVGYFLIDGQSGNQKLIRNTLGTHTIFYDDNNNPIKWEHFIDLLLVNIQAKEGLHLETKITSRHINWYQEKMKMKLAPQTFSPSVAKALQYLRGTNHNQKFTDTEPTERFIIFINDAFDILNSRNSLAKGSKLVYIQQYNKTSVFNRINQVIKYITSLTYGPNREPLHLSLDPDTGVGEWHGETIKAQVATRQTKDGCRAKKARNVCDTNLAYDREPEKKGADNITRETVEARLELLETYWLEFTSNDDKLRAKEDAALLKSTYFTNNLYDGTEEAYITEKAGLKQLLGPATVQLGTVAAPQQPKRQSMPKIALVPFDGNFTQWTSFRDLFRSLTNVTGEPAELLNHIPVTDEDFSRAWKLLEKEYDSIPILVNAQLGVLLSLPSMKTESAAELKTLLNGTRNAVEALAALKRPVEHWSDWLNFITVQRLDGETRLSWETTLEGKEEMPTFSQLSEFLRARLRSLTVSSLPSCNLLATAASSHLAVPSTSTARRPPTPSAERRAPTPSATPRGTNRRPTEHTVTGTPGASRCRLCQKDHFVLFCPAFKSLTPPERRKLVIENNLCFNCLSNHHVRDCKSSKRCQTCVGKHHTALHIPHENRHSGDNFDASSSVSKPVAKTVNCTRMSQTLILATAIVGIEVCPGERIFVRALIDPCSEVSLIGESIVQRFKLPRKPFNIPLEGVDSMRSRPRGRVNLTVSSRLDPTVSYAVDAVILPRLSSYEPPITSGSSTWPHLNDLELADPEITSRQPIELLLGADIYALIIREGLRQGAAGSPVAQATTLGWIVTGSPGKSNISPSNPRRIILHCSVDDDISTLLQRFWSLEEVAAPPSSSEFTADEDECENHFVRTHTRDHTGRYIVRLPFKRAFALLEKIQKNYYLPHHGVWRESSSTTKLRVVFNGSSKTTTGISLNDILHSGPNLLPEIPDLLLRWRCHAIVFAADMENMYRQIWLAHEDRHAQSILWRRDSDGEVDEYRLRTVTYGLACAPYLAMRTIRQLSSDEESRFPLAAACLRSDVYMDDVLSGASTIDEALEVQKQLIAALKAGGFTLRKWTSNEPGLLDHLSAEHIASSGDRPIENIFTLLGLRWQSAGDFFLFDLKPREPQVTITKRQVLKEMASVYDPLGFLAPVTVTAKIFLQTLWLLKLDWNDPLPPAQTKYWSTYSHSLAGISAVRIPRWLHDAKIYLWSDSTIVLSWLQGRPSKWKTFVANRVAEIQNLYSPDVWHHIRSKDNPADPASRGLSGDALAANSLWWQGPSFLSTSTREFKEYYSTVLDTEEERRSEKTVLSTTVAAASSSQTTELFSRYSSFMRLLRSVAWCLRFINCARRTSTVKDTCLRTDELDNARLTIVRCEQLRLFSTEIACLEGSRSLLRGPLVRLSPFLDERGILRVGGRLKHSLLDYDEKHPIIMPEKSKVTSLIIVYFHERLLHGGTQLTLSNLRRMYWIPRGRQAVRKHIHGCLKCWRWRAKTSEQLMSDLPYSRVTPTRPFYHTGVDYAGPFNTKFSPGRGARTRKSYVSVFVCLATRAVHLELVCDYSSEAFLAAYRRFVSRRGLCASIRSDCGTTFVGADKELRRMLNTSNEEMLKTRQALAVAGTDWVFNPPSAPHFGGIWEAAVKSVKYHLRRVIGETLLTFEEMSTLLTQIEACLNSRPITPLTDEPTDLTALTPAHFLIGSPLTAIPEPSLSDVRASRLTRWQMIQQQRDHFWDRWSVEYLQTLQQRTKWTKEKPNLKPGDLCLILNEATPPTLVMGIID
ncbi:uncharacterized protein LOC143215848 [Lasioglossum baleicum]|uniref:uncharacterized protein LOC143215848 n=1 Tax=Lasioglossum baleicum TaxID=434251 RepID=UPI003FCC48DB